MRNRADGSGSTVAIAGLASGLRSLGHSVHVLRPRHTLWSVNATRMSYNLTLRTRVAEVADSYEVVVGFDYDGWALPPLVHSRYVVALKGIAADERRFEAGWSRLRFGVWSALEGRNARSADRVFVTSEYSRRKAIQAYGLRPDRVRLAPEGIDPEIAPDNSAGSRNTGSLPAPIILSVARQYRRKDSTTLLRAMLGVLAAVPGVTMRIVGDGPELARTRRLAAQLGLRHEVNFLGSLDSVPALHDEYARASVFCLPSLQEGFGIVFLEAMSHGLPVVAVAAGAVPEVAPHGETSLLVPPGDHIALTEALVRILTDHDLAARFGDAGKRRARRYGWSSTAHAFLEGLNT